MIFQTINWVRKTDIYKDHFLNISHLKPNFKQATLFSSHFILIATKKWKIYITRHWQNSGGKTLCPGNDKLLNFICKKEELPEQWMESIIINIYKKANKTYCSNYGGISPLSTTHTILSSIYLSRLARYVDEITGNHQCGVACTKSTT
jgi:hypothetical protein